MMDSSTPARHDVHVRATAASARPARACSRAQGRAQSARSPRGASTRKERTSVRTSIGRHDAHAALESPEDEDEARPRFDAIVRPSGENRRLTRASLSQRSCSRHCLSTNSPHARERSSQRLMSARGGNLAVAVRFKLPLRDDRKPEAPPSLFSPLPNATEVEEAARARTRVCG